MFLLCSAILLITWLLWYYFLKKPKYNLPPGPPRFPVIGSLISLFLADAKRPAVAFVVLSKKYGPVFSLQLGSLKAIVINSYEAYKKVGNSEHLLSHNDEDDLWLLEKSCSIPIGLIFSLPEFWAKTRGFTHKTLGKYGFKESGRTSTLIIEEVAEFCDELRNKMTNGELVMSMDCPFNSIFFNITWTTLTGKKYGTNDARTKELLAAMQVFLKSGKFAGSIAQIYPKLIHIFPGWTGFTKLRNFCVIWRSMFREILAEERAQDYYSDTPNNFLQEFLQKVDETEKPTNLLDSIFTDENVMTVLQDFSMAGTDTQSNSMSFLVTYLIQNPEIQAKLQEEVDRVVGNSRLVNMNDIPGLIYLQAFLYEVYRLGSVGPIIARKLLQDWKYEEYTIPKGTWIMQNNYGASRDEAVWADPYKFDPSRFLSPDGTSLINTEKIVAFGLGKRRCVGEQVAKTTMIIATTTFIQNFSFHVDPSEGMPKGEDIHGFTRSPAPFNFIVKSR